jgi:hypothetical protein
MQLVGMLFVAGGAAISATGIGAIAGIPMAIFGIYRVFKGKNLTVKSSYRN